jgi:hypothetical protein
MLNSKTLLPGGFIDQKQTLPLCAHEHAQVKCLLSHAMHLVLCN